MLKIQHGRFQAGLQAMMDAGGAAPGEPGSWGLPNKNEA
jgi:hypothetical protein